MHIQITATDLSISHSSHRLNSSNKAILNQQSGDRSFSRVRHTFAECILLTTALPVLSLSEPQGFPGFMESLTEIRLSEKKGSCLTDRRTIKWSNKPYIIRVSFQARYPKNGLSSDNNEFYGSVDNYLQVKSNYFTCNQIHLKWITGESSMNEW